MRLQAFAWPFQAPADSVQKRPSARLIVLNPSGRVLLFHFVFHEGALAGKAFWATPGGALRPGESYPEAARRGLVEETGIFMDIGAEIARREAIFRTPDGVDVAADERYFLVQATSDQVNQDGQEPLETKVIAAYRWWSRDELRDTSETVYPADLAEIVEQQL